MKRLFVLLFFFQMLSSAVFGQVQEKLAYGSHLFYIIDATDTNVHYEVGFVFMNKIKGDSIGIDYSSVDLRRSHIQYKKMKRTKLADEIPYYDSIFAYIFEKHPEIVITNVSIADPTEWDDIIANQVAAFQNDVEWKKRGIKDKNPNYALTKTLMQQYDVYKPIRELMEKYNYQLQEYSTHKIALLGTKSLKNQASYIYKGKILIPIPYEFGMSFIKL